MKPHCLLSFLVAGVAVAAVGPSPVFKVATIPIARLAQESDLIIEASVTSVREGVGDTRVASCKPTATWKGHPGEIVEFLASPTWTCDIATAVSGERVVLFLRVDESGQLCIYHSGRGRMPRREFNGHEYATFFGDITFPEGTVTTLGGRTMGSYSKGIEVDELKRLIAEAIEAARQDRQRWLDAMPFSLKSLWPTVEKQLDENTEPEIDSLYLALVKDTPAEPERIRALLSWYGSGQGPWWGYHGYESVAEKLLLRYTTESIVTAIEGRELTIAETEGAARLLAGWQYSQARPNDLRPLPDELKQRLLAHSLKSSDEGKRRQAQNAFGKP